MEDSDEKLLWTKKQVENFKDKYLLVLPKQNVQGRIQQISSNSATVASWRYIQAEENVFYLQVGQSEVPFQKVNDQILSAAPDLSATGTGVNIELPIADKVAGKEGNASACPNIEYNKCL